MIEKVLKAVTEALKQEGFETRKEFSFASEELRGPLVCVSAGQYKCLDAGMGRYLGVRREENGAQRELFGKRLELELVFEVYAPFGEDGAALCRSTADRLCGLADILPEGIRLLEMSCGALEAREALAAYSISCRARCMALFTADASGDEDEFLDFVLKGVVRDVN